MGSIHGQRVSIRPPQLGRMNNQARRPPFEMLFRVMTGLEVEDLERFQAMLPFLLEAEWASASLSWVERSATGPGGFDSLAEEAVARLVEQLPERQTRVVAFLLADWGRAEITGIEPALGHLRETFPVARIEAWLMPEPAEHRIELILVAGASV